MIMKMVKSNPRHYPAKTRKYKRLASMGQVSRSIISKLYNPIDATNRFLNLALQNVEEDSQSRQFLLESKLGLKRMAVLVRRLDTYADRIEEEFNKVLRKRNL